MTPTPLEDLISSGLAELSLEPEAAGPLASLATLVDDWGKRINLTGHRDASAVARRLVLDAAALHTVLPAVGSLVDLGSGAGFPGLPLAILRPQASFVLVEARERRHHFQRHAVRSLGLENVRVVRGRFEELDPDPADCVVAQAVASPDVLVGWMLRWARPGALLVVPGGTFPRTVADAGALLDPRNDTYRVPLGGPERTVWVSRAA